MLFDWDALEGAETQKIDIRETSRKIRQLVCKYWDYKTHIAIHGEQHTTATLKATTSSNNRMYNSQMDKVTQFNLDNENKFIVFVRSFDDAVASIDDGERELFKRYFLHNETGATIARDMNITEHQFYKKRDRAMVAFATSLGVEVYQ